MKTPDEIREELARMENFPPGHPSQFRDGQIAALKWALGEGPQVVALGRPE